MNRALLFSLVIAALLGGTGVLVGNHLRKERERNERLEEISRISHKRGEEMGQELQALEALVRTETLEEWRCTSSGGGGEILETSFKYDHECEIVASKDASEDQVNAFAAKLAALPEFVEWQAQAGPQHQTRKLEFKVEHSSFYQSFTLKVILTVRFEPKID